MSHTRQRAIQRRKNVSPGSSGGIQRYDLRIDKGKAKAAT